VRQLREENGAYRQQLGMAEEKLEETAGAKEQVEGDLKGQVAELQVRVEELLDDLER
jgi:hypothetical protein